MIKIITTRMMKTRKRNERKKFIERFSFLFDIHHHTLLSSSSSSSYSFTTSRRITLKLNCHAYILSIAIVIHHKTNARFCPPTRFFVDFFLFICNSLAQRLQNPCSFTKPCPNPPQLAHRIILAIAAGSSGITHVQYFVFSL